jgi:hypothetical protein
MSDEKIATDWTSEDSSTRYPLPGGNWVEFRDEVPYGEQADLDIACKPLPDEKALPKRLAYHITGWSLTYPAKKGGGSLPVCEESLEAMPMPRLWRLIAALQTHTEATKARYADPLSDDDSSSASPSAA